MEEDDIGDFFASEENREYTHFENISPLIIRRSGFDSPQLTSDPSYTVNSSSLSYGMYGRNKNRFTVILEKFSTKNKKSPKREYFNAFIIRAIKRAFRNIISSKVPRSTCISIDLGHPLQSMYWNELGNLYRGNVRLVTELAKTESGPKTDGKKRGSKARNTESERGHKSFNNQFCQEFFSSKVSQQAFHCIVELIYSELNVITLCKKFKLSCCPTVVHSNDDCFLKWQELKDYLLLNYLKDLDVRIVENNPEVDMILSFPD